MTMSKTDIYFYKFLVNNQVFYKSKYTYALVNIKPLVPGHVLVVPYRTEIERFADLTAEESQDYMQTLQLVHKFIIHVYKADSLNIAIQDGPEAGQSIPHLHTHLIPRYALDGFGDGIYEKLEKLDMFDTLTNFFQRREAFKECGKFEKAADEDRKPRSQDEMLAEANWLKSELAKYQQA
ncbi:Piso0_001547 [Millerozyma farinosa CBS 7064]|uniref:Bis(5'-adenosyl)-triphosphatase n=1 Tax=Pichia sorbitophila (strain ATCC MYA-4447 / BCRC 22081 / CBS 7064 / NBRC 10061 / NRRL Y-12695) TaxID=559304 RepID=G8YNG4_PICSO|nr:Piso0_001547 [Millerozyma farinosa CBS 7064]